MSKVYGVKGQNVEQNIQMLTRAVLELAGFFPVETVTNRLSVSENTQKQNLGPQFHDFKMLLYMRLWEN
jgi:hypothetical protein